MAKRKRKRHGSLVYGANPSKPGDPPHKQRGRLLASVAWEVVDTVARVGTNLNYGRWLELGTTKMAARPWLRRALAETRDEVLRILSAPMNLK
jgi:phage gpG-like protein